MKKIIRIWSLILGIMVLFPGGLSAQQKTLIRGTIIDKDKYPLAQATVIEADKDNRTITSAVADLDGNFSINVVDTKNVLVIKYIGYKEKKVRIGDQRVINIVMDDDAHQLTEFVVTAKPKQNLGGLLIDERDLSMAVGRINAEEIAEVHAASIDDALQGRIAGVDIVGTTGNPGGGMAIRIRGTSSITGDNMPLIVIDGIPMESTVGTSTNQGFDLSTATEEEFSQLLNIPPNDIAEITVLKDAAASAIYGSRGADGVLLITTKRGTISAPRITFNSTFTVDKQPDAIKRLSGTEYSTLMMESMLNAGLILNTSVYPEFAYDPNYPSYYYNYSQDTDWVKELTQTGFTQDYNVSISGGSRKVRYRFSTGYWDQKGITIETGFERLYTRMNLDYFVSDKLRFSADIAYTHSDKQANYIPETSDNTKGDLRDKAYIKMPNQSIYTYNEYGEKTDQYFTPQNNIQGSFPNVYNPIAIARDGKNDLRSDKITPKFSLVYDYSNEWQFKMDVAFDITNEKRQKYLPQTATGLSWNNTNTNFASDSDNETFVIQTFSQVRYIPEFKNKDHRIIGLLGLNTYDNQSKDFYVASSNLPSAVLQDPSVGGIVNLSGRESSGTSQQRSLSAYANLNYALKDRYIVYGSVRVDGNSRFGENYRYGVFPAISGRYRVSGEPFMQGLSKWIDDFSIRGSWGVNGKTPKYNDMFRAMYNTYGYTYLGNKATYPSSLALNDLRWERTTQKNLAFNLVAFDNRINVEFDTYWKTTKDGLGSTAIPSSSGFSGMTANLNTVENIGWELNVQTTPYKNKDWLVNFNFNIARSQNYLRKISEYMQVVDGNWQDNGNYLIRLEKDQPYGAFYGYKYKGVYLNEEQTIARDKNGNHIYTLGDNGQLEPVYMKFGYPSVGYEFQPGDARYEDINNDGNINYQDVVYLGDYNPLFTGGFGPTVRFKGFSVSAWFYFRYGNDVINMSRMQMEKMYNFDNQSRSVLRRFRQPYENPADAPSDLLPRALYNDGYNWLGSDRFVEDGSFLRWKTLTFKYMVPKKVVNNFGVSDLSVWLTLQNLYTWTDYTGQDPEVKISGSLSEVGRDYANAPRAKQFTLGFTLGF
ncbi:SusC/RagA family TonB-linked outer membrane protein [Dysgonomonas sp. 216]|uniref:SusC/RagA family TonB-linked outer membrane protein n=1 Tax=Dysgonomonas sp. 216 TaxID=2302934 RepID=UPI0013D83219|nr:SusC/RagA family TonB-linked outer membrane protein [Dysgonomonas sp. 216]